MILQLANDTPAIIVPRNLWRALERLELATVIIGGCDVVHHEKNVVILPPPARSPNPIGEDLPPWPADFERYVGPIVPNDLQ